MQGRFELNIGDFRKAKRKFASGSNAEVELDKLFEDYFVKTTKTPRLIQEVARHVLDGICDKEKCIYTFHSLPRIDIFYRESPSSAAKAKTQNLESQMKLAFNKTVENNGKIPDEFRSDGTSEGGKTTESKAGSKTSSKEWKAGSGLAHALQKGLTQDDLSLKELNFLCERMIQELQYKREKQPMPQEFFKLGDQRQRCYPIWNNINERIDGSLSMCASIKRARAVTSKMRYDIVNLLASYLRGLFYVKDGGSGIIMVPFDIGMISYRQPFKLYKLLLENMHPAVSKFFCIEICGLNKNDPSTDIRQGIIDIADRVQYVAIENDVLFPFWHQFGDARPFATGFNITKAHNSGVEPYYQIQQFENFAEEQGQDIYIKNVTSDNDLKFLRKQNVQYIIGTVIKEPRPKPFPTGPHMLDEED